MRQQPAEFAQRNRHRAPEPFPVQAQQPQRRGAVQLRWKHFLELVVSRELLERAAFPQRGLHRAPEVALVLAQQLQLRVTANRRGHCSLDDVSNPAVQSVGDQRIAVKRTLWILRRGPRPRPDQMLSQTLPRCTLWKSNRSAVKRTLRIWERSPRPRTDQALRGSLPKVHAVEEQ